MLAVICQAVMCACAGVAQATPPGLTGIARAGSPWRAVGYPKLSSGLRASRVSVKTRPQGTRRVRFDTDYEDVLVTVRGWPSPFAWASPSRSGRSAASPVENSGLRRRLSKTPHIRWGRKRTYLRVAAYRVVYSRIPRCGAR